MGLVVFKGKVGLLSRGKIEISEKTSLVSTIVDLPRGAKRLVQVVFDSVSLTFAYLLSVRLTFVDLSDQITLLLGLAFVLTSLVGLKFLGVYRTLTRYAGVRFLELVALAQLASTCLMVLLAWIFDLQSSLAFLLLVFLLSTCAV